MSPRVIWPLCLPLFLLTPLCGDTVVVDSSDPEAYQTVQEGWNAAGPGDTIEVYPGIDGWYYEAGLTLDGRTNPPGLKDGITLRAVGDVTLAGLGDADKINVISVQDFLMEGFAITHFGNHEDWYGHAFQIVSASNALDHPMDNAVFKDLVIYGCAGVAHVRDWTNGGGGEIQFINHEWYDNVTYREGQDPVTKGCWWYNANCHYEGIYSHDEGGHLHFRQTPTGVPVHGVIRNCDISGLMRDNSGMLVGPFNGTNDNGATVGYVLIEGCTVHDIPNGTYEGRGLNISCMEADIEIRDCTVELCKRGAQIGFSFDKNLWGPGGTQGENFPYQGLVTVSDCRFEYNEQYGLRVTSAHVILDGVACNLNAQSGMELIDTAHITKKDGDLALWDYALPLDAEVRSCVAIDNFQHGFVTRNSNGGTVRYYDCVADNNGMADGGWNGTGFVGANCMYVLYEDCISLEAGVPGSVNMSIGFGFQIIDCILGVGRRCVAADCAAGGFWLEHDAHAELDHCLAYRNGRNGWADNLWVFVGNVGIEGRTAPDMMHAVITNLTSCDVQGDSGLYTQGNADHPETPAYLAVRNSVFAGNANVGLWNNGNGMVVDIDYADFHDNTNGAFGGDGTTNVGPHVMYEDPLFIGEYLLDAGSPLIDAGDPRDLGPDGTRADMGYHDEQGNPYRAWLNRQHPEDGGRLWLQEMPRVGHAEIGFPFEPTGSGDPSDMLFYEGQPYDVTNHFYMWDNVGKTYLLYPYDFASVTVGQGYLYLNVTGGRADSPIDIDYDAAGAPRPGTVEIPLAGRSVIAIPGGQPIWQGDLLVRNNTTGEVRNAQMDAAQLEPWIGWNWVYWSFAANAYDICFFGGGAGDTYVRPWQAYQVWAFTEDLTLFFPGQ